MQKWEYKLITMSPEQVLEMGLQWAGWNVATELSQLGEDGWELVSVTSLSSDLVAGRTTDLVWVFKRPKQGQAGPVVPKQVPM